MPNGDRIAVGEVIGEWQSILPQNRAPINHWDTKDFVRGAPEIVRDAGQESARHAAKHQNGMSSSRSSKPPDFFCAGLPDAAGAVAGSGSRAVLSKPVAPPRPPSICMRSP